jgi:hypothetical protein
MHPLTTTKNAIPTCWNKTYKTVQIFVKKKVLDIGWATQNTTVLLFVLNFARHWRVSIGL